MNHPTWPSLLLKAVLFQSFFLICSTLSLSAQDCCDTTDCALRVQQFVDRFVPFAVDLGEAPQTREETETKLNALQGQNSHVHEAFLDLVQEYASWAERARFRTECFVFKLGNDNAEIGDWIGQVRSLSSKSGHRSNQFCRGFRFQMEGGLGVANLGARSESFNASLRGLVSYTFAPTDPAVEADSTLEHCNGWFRILAGLSETYIAQCGVLQGIVRAEVKILPILKSDFLGAAGNVKLLLQASEGITREMRSFGGGLGIELDIIALHIVYEDHSRIANSSVQVNLAYRF